MLACLTEINAGRVYRHHCVIPVSGDHFRIIFSVVALSLDSDHAKCGGVISAWTMSVVFINVCLCESATGGGHDNIVDSAANRRNLAVNTTSDIVMTNRMTNSCQYYDEDYDDDDDVIMAPVFYRVRPARCMSGYPSRRPSVCLSVCHSAHQSTSINTSLYPMIGSCCTTSSCYVDSLPRPRPPAANHNHDCSSSACYGTVYEYALGDSYYSQSIPGLSLMVDSSEMTVDCSSVLMKGGTSVTTGGAPESLKSWSTVHSAPAVLDPRYRPKLPPLQGNDRPRRFAAAAAERPQARVRRDEICCCHHHSGLLPYSNAYRPTYAAYADAAADDDDDDVDDNDLRYDKLPASSSLRLAKPVLAETQYWV